MFISFGDVQTATAGKTPDQIAAAANQAAIPAPLAPLPNPPAPPAVVAPPPVNTGLTYPTPAPAPAPAPAPVAQTQNQLYSPAASYTGNSIVDFLSKAGQPSDFTSRTKLAQQYGITNYTGTAGQNTQLLGLLKAHATGAVTDLGIPHNINDITGAGGAPDPTKPLDASGLSVTNGTSINNILNASVKSGTIDSETAGLLALSGASTEADQKYNDLVTQLTDTMGKLDNQGADMQTALDANGVSKGSQDLQQTNLEIAQLKGKSDAFDVETQKGLDALDKQQAEQGFINIDKNAYQTQRAVQKGAITADLSAKVALAQAYQGNIDLGTKLAQQSVDLKYKPIENQIATLQAQLSAAKETMTVQDNKVSSVINALLKIKSDELATEKDTQKQIQTLAIQAATNGAPLSLVQQMQAAKDATTAASIGSKYIKGNLETTLKGPGTTPAPGAIKFTQDDIQRLTAVGLTSSDITNIQADINAHGIDAVLPGLPADQQKVVKDVLGGVTATQAAVNPAAKQYLSVDYIKSKFNQADLEQDAKDAGFTKKSGGLFNTGFGAKTLGDVNTYVNWLLKDKITPLREQGIPDDTIVKILGYG